MDKGRQRLAVPPRAGQAKVLGHLSQRRVDLGHLLIVQAPWTTGTLSVYQSGQTLGFESAYPIRYRPRRVAQEVADLSTTHALGDQQQAMQSVVITRLGRTLNLVLDRQNHRLGIGNRELFHTGKVTILAIMRNYLRRYI